MTVLVEIRGVTKTYRRGGETIEVLHGIDLDIPRGDCVALMGPSGSGKTTLLNLIGGLDTPTAGTVAIDGRRIDRLSSGDLSRWRAANVGFVFQFYNLLPVLSAQRNVELPLLLTGLSAAERRRHAEIALTLVGLRERAKHKPKELSGGQEQRVAIARAIVSDPTLLVWRKTRTVLTVLSVLVAFLLFGLLEAVQVAFESGADSADAKRLLTTARYSIIDPLPMAYASRIERVPGVVGIAYADWFGAKYQNESNAFAVFAVDPARYLDMYPEFQIDPAQREAFVKTRTGAVVGQRLMERYGRHAGQRLPLRL